MSDGPDDLTFSHIHERDIGLLVVEELKCSRPFQRWFLRTLLMDTPQPRKISVAHVNVRHIVTETGPDRGESDIIADFEVDAPKVERIRVRIENKIDAPFGDSQAERYEGRARQDLAEGEFDRSLCILMAPNDYIEAVPDGAARFHETISYEQIAEALGERADYLDEESSRRCWHKMEMLEQAIHKHRRGYTAEPDPKVTEFWQGYWDDARQAAAGLRMDRPADKPSRSGFVHFTRSIQSKRPLPGCKIVHKLGHGRVDLQITGWADRLEAVANAIKSRLAAGVTLRKAGKSLAISIEAPVLDTTRPFEEQRDKAWEGMDAASRLQAWFNQNHEYLRGVAATQIE